MLESRALLAGNVVVQFNGRSLSLHGDSSSNSVQLVAESGNLLVRGLDGTTVNGSSSAFTVLTGSTSIPREFSAHLGGGNDRLSVGAGVIIGREVFISGGAGDDTIGIVSSQIGRSVNIFTDSGNDQVSIQNSTINRDASVHGGGSGLLLNISNSTVGDDLFVSGTGGNDSVVLSSATINDDVFITTHGGIDDIAVRSSNMGDDVRIFTGEQDDSVYIDASTIADRSWIFFDGGNDNLVVEGQSRFNDRLRTYGGGGSDLWEIAATAALTSFRTSSVSSGNVNDALVQTRITGATTGAFAKASSLATQFAPVLTVQTGVSTIAESAGTAATTVTISRSVAAATALTVTLTSSNTSKLTVPATAVIPAGQTSVVVNLNAVNNDLFDPDAVVTLTAAASGFTTATASITVTNEDVRRISLAVNNASFSESAGTTAATVTVSRNTSDNSAAQTVSLSMTSNGRITIPSTVTIPAGSASTTFAVAAVPNAVDDGDQQVTISGSTSGFTNGSVNVTVTDDDSPALTLQVNSSLVQENATSNTITYTLIRNAADISQPLTVNLNSGSQSRISVPATVTIPANTATFQFSGTITDNQLDDGNLLITTTATAPDFNSPSVSVTVVDDEPSVLSVSFSVDSILENAGAAALTATVSRNARGTTDQTVQITYPSSGRISGPTSAIIPAGQLSAVISIDVVNNSIVEGNQTISLNVSATNFTPGADTLLITEDDSLLLTTDISQNTFIQSNNTVITQSAPFVLSGTTEPGASVTLDADGDGQFDDGTVVANPSGQFTFNVTLTHTAANRGANALAVRSEFNGIIAPATVNVHLATGTVVRFETNLGQYDVELLNADAPITVQNFLTYMNSTAYDNLIIHRSVPNFVIQGGGFKVNGGAVTAVTTNAAIQNEFNAANSNLRGTLSMALVSGNINSGTSQWFINTVNNTTLNSASHTVFGRVIGNGMDIVDDIAAVPPRNIANLYDITALGETPLLNAPGSGTSLTGTVSLTIGSNLLIGTGTSFLTQLQVGDSLEISGRLFFVQSIESNTALTLRAASPIAASNASALADVTPNDSDFVVFSNISQLLAAL